MKLDKDEEKYFTSTELTIRAFNAIQKIQLGREFVKLRDEIEEVKKKNGQLEKRVKELEDFKRDVEESVEILNTSLKSLQMIYPNLSKV